MDRLPVEILVLICANLKEDADIKTFRRLARCYAEIGLKYLSPVLHIACLPESWEKLEEVSNDPVMRHHVRELLFEPSVLQAYGTFDLYERAAQRTAPRDHDFNQDQLQEGWSLYNEAFREQMLLYTRLQTPGVFKAALARFPNLHVIRLQTGGLHFASSWTNDDTAEMKLNKHFRKYLVNPRVLTSINEADRTTCNLLQDVAALNLKLDELFIGFTHWRLLQAADTVWKSILKASRHLTKFKLHMVFNHPEDDIELDDDTEDPEDVMWDQVNAFDAWKAEQRENQNDRLNVLLESMPKLEVLDLSFHVHHRGWDEGSRQLGWLCSCLESHPPSNLRELSLHHIETDKLSMQQMLQSCASSLRSLAMGHIQLRCIDDWVDIVSELPRVLKLDRIWLGSNLGEGGEDFDSDETPFNFDYNWKDDAGSQVIGRAIKNLLLKTDEAMIDTTCAEIRRLMTEMRAALSIESDEQDRYHEELMGNYESMLMADQEEEWTSTSGEDEENESDNSDDSD